MHIEVVAATPTAYMDMMCIRPVFTGCRAPHLWRIVLNYLVICACIACSTVAEGGAETRIKALRYPGGYDFRTHERPEYSTFTVSFLARLTYPSDAVVEFYGREVEKLGWSPIDKVGDPRGYRKWDCYEDSTRPGSPFLHQFGARWVNPEKTRMVFVVVLYYSKTVSRQRTPCLPPESDIQHVDVQLSPFVLPPK